MPFISYLSTWCEYLNVAPNNDSQEVKHEFIRILVEIDFGDRITR